MRFRNSVVCIIVMNALQPNDMLPDAILANDNSYSSCSWRREDLRLQGSTGPKTGGYQSKKGYEQRTDRVATT